MSKIELENAEKLIQALDNLEMKLSREHVQRAVKEGARIILDAAKANAPVDTGTLQDGIVPHLEKKRREGKVVYDIYMDPKKNAIFQKPIMRPVRSESKYAYYPASQEYGFFAKRPAGGMIFTRPQSRGKYSYGSSKTNKVPGKHYMLRAADTVGEKAKNAVANALLQAIEKEFGD